MIFQFKSTAIGSVLLDVIIIAAFITELMDIIPFMAAILCIFVCFLLQIGLVSLSLKFYSDVVDTANNDPEAFFKKNRRLYEKAWGRYKVALLSNEIKMLVLYERFDELPKRLAEYVQLPESRDAVGRYQYLSFLVTADVHRRDFSNMDAYINDMRMCISQMNTAGNGVTPKLRQRFELNCEQHILEAEFYSRTPELLRGADRELAVRYLQVEQETVHSVNEMKVMKKCAQANLDYDTGVIYAVLGDEEKALMYMKRAADTGYVYPFVARAKQYISDRNVDALMTQGF